MSANRIQHGLKVWLPVLAAAVILGSQILVPPIVGVADNADFVNVNIPLQLAPAPPYADDRFFRYIVPVWVYDTRLPVYFRLITSELVLIAPFAYLSRVFFGGEFDLRWAGLIHMAIFLWALYVAAPLLSRRWWVALGVVLAFCDVAYFSFFNSMYMDAASFVFLMLAAAFYLRIDEGARFFVGFAVALVFFVTSKLQHAYLIVFLIPFLFLDTRLRKHCAAAGRVTLAVALLLSFAWLKSHVPADYQAFAAYNVIFYHLLPNSAAPRVVLEELGLPPGMSVLSGTTAFVGRSGISDPRFRPALLERSLHVELARHYIRHPGVAWGMIKEALQESALERQAGYGNFAKNAVAEPSTRSNAFALISGARTAIFEGRPIWYALFHGLVALAVLGMGWWRERGVLVPAALILCMAALEFFASALADCLETTRHLFLFRALLDMLFWLAIGLAAKIFAADERFRGAFSHR
ncbi:MAG: hypothetical protein HY820_41690 [Acidobacteria bacterium]|nr:hypothetical protein [Acidobacteriota bacterium]